MSRVEGHKGVRGGGTGGGNSLLTARERDGLQSAKADRNSFTTRLARLLPAGRKTRVINSLLQCRYGLGLALRRG